MEVLLFMSKTVEYWQLHIQPSVCVCVCVCVRERERERET